MHGPKQPLDNLKKRYWQNEDGNVPIARIQHIHASGIQDLGSQLMLRSSQNQQKEGNTRKSF